MTPSEGSAYVSVTMTSSRASGTERNVVCQETVSSSTRAPARWRSSPSTTPSSSCRTTCRPGLGMKKKAPHAAILKLVTTNICGADQHMVRGRTTAPVGQTLGHEITGEVVEVGDDVLFVKEGDICSVPFNIACGRCRMCNEGKTGVCLNVNPARAGAAYGYVDMGGWLGGQAEYVMVPFADFNLLKFPDRDQALEKILDLTMLSDIFPTGYHGAYTAGVTTGSTVYVAGAGPVGLAAAYSAQLLGASVVDRRRHERRPAPPGRELRLRDRGPQLRQRPGRDDRADRRRAGGGRGRRCGGLRGPRPRRGRR